MSIRNRLDQIENRIPTHSHESSREDLEDRLLRRLKKMAAQFDRTDRTFKQHKAGREGGDFVQPDSIAEWVAFVMFADDREHMAQITDEAVRRGERGARVAVRLMGFEIRE